MFYGKYAPFKGNRTLCGESLKDAARPRPFLSPGIISKLHVGTWNVRTLYAACKTAQVASEIRNYNITMLGLSETRWTESGQMRLTTREMVFYSGLEEINAPHTKGVPFMLSQEAQQALITWEAAGPWIIIPSFRTKMRRSKINSTIGCRVFLTS